MFQLSKMDNFWRLMYKNVSIVNKYCMLEICEEGNLKCSQGKW